MIPEALPGRCVGTVIRLGEHKQLVRSSAINSTSALDPLIGYPKFAVLNFLPRLSGDREPPIYINPCISQSGKWEKRHRHRKKRNWSGVRQGRYDLANPIRSRYYSFPEL